MGTGRQITKQSATNRYFVFKMFTKKKEMLKKSVIQVRNVILSFVKKLFEELLSNTFYYYTLAYRDGTGTL